MTPTTLRELQARVDAYIGQFEEGYWHPLANLARLSEEVGELARWLNHRYGEKPLRPEELAAAERRTKETGLDPVAEELADILFVVACLANITGSSLAASFDAVMEKVEGRDGQRWTAPRRDAAEPADDRN